MSQSLSNIEKSTKPLRASAFITPISTRRQASRLMIDRVNANNENSPVSYPYLTPGIISSGKA
jgi:hypothetical protein